MSAQPPSPGTHHGSAPAPSGPAVAEVGRHRLLVAAWLCGGVVLCSLAGMLTATSYRFDWQLEVVQMPAATLAAGMALAGLLPLALLPLIRRSLALPPSAQRGILGLVLVAGALARLVLLPSHPALEDDFNRYLWEGALVVHGMSPYGVTPSQARAAKPSTTLGRLAQDAGPVLARVNHPDMASTYPPVAQAAFALAHLVAPWSLDAWRLVCLACDAACLALVILLLGQAGLSPLWAALYWWNPLVLKELVNSAHMDGLVVALTLGALLASARGRHGTAAAVLALALGAKLWPVLLAPLVLRPLYPSARRLSAAAAVLAAAMALWLWLSSAPASGVESGYLTYARHWTTNSALFPVLESLGRLVLSPWNAEGLAWAVARAATALALGMLALGLARKPISGRLDLMRRATAIVTALVLLSPAQFPWYLVWLTPFVCFQPHWALLVPGVTVPLYYLDFHLIARGHGALFRDWVVWIIWVPVWVSLTYATMYASRDGGFLPRGADKGRGKPG